MFSHFVKWGELVDQMVYPPHQDFINIRKGIRNCLYQHSPNTVSYTHLTLPTILLV